MTKMCRIGDVDTSGHKMLNGSTDVFAGGVAVSRIGDVDNHSFLQDGVPLKWDNKITTSRTTKSVFINGKAVLRIGDLDDNTHGQTNKDVGNLIGDVMMTGHPDIEVGG